jgi:hypothetical protein
MRRSGLTIPCISTISVTAPALLYLPTSLSVAWWSLGLFPTIPCISTIPGGQSLNNSKTVPSDSRTWD